MPSLLHAPSPVSRRVHCPFPQVHHLTSMSSLTALLKYLRQCQIVSQQINNKSSSSSWSLVHTQSLSDSMSTDTVDLLASWFHLVSEPNPCSLQSLTFTYSSVSILCLSLLHRTTVSSFYLCSFSFSCLYFSSPLPVTLHMLIQIGS